MFYVKFMLLFFSNFQFNLLKDQGTRVIIYNLWEDDQGQLELDFDEDPNVCPITETHVSCTKKQKGYVYKTNCI